MNTILDNDIEQAPPLDDKRHVAKKGGGVGTTLTAYCGVRFVCVETGTPARALSVATCQDCIFKLKSIYRL